MADTHLVTDVETLRLRPQGPATAGIWLRSGDSEFPMAGWQDFVVVVLSWWSAAILKLVRKSGESERVQFMDGPYAVELCFAQPGKLQLRMFAGPSGGREVGKGEADLKRFVGELAASSRRLLDECRLRNWWSADAQALESHVADSAHELEIG